MGFGGNQRGKIIGSGTVGNGNLPSLVASKSHVASRFKFQTLEHMLSSRHVSGASRVQVP